MEEKAYDEAMNDYETVNGRLQLEDSNSRILLLILSELKEIKKRIKTPENRK